MVSFPAIKHDSEYIVQCNPDGKIIGPILWNDAHNKTNRPLLTHYSTWSMVFNPIIGKYGIQMKNPKKHDIYSAGRWDMGVAGHNCYVLEGDVFRPLGFGENLVKEAEEEIGIHLDMFESLDKFILTAKELIRQKHIPKSIGYIFDTFHYKTDTNNEFVGLGFILTTGQDIFFTDKEVVRFMWLGPDELMDFLAKNKNYCAPLPMVFDKAETFRKENLGFL